MDPAIHPGKGPLVRRHYTLCLHPETLPFPAGNQTLDPDITIWTPLHYDPHPRLEPGFRLLQNDFAWAFPMRGHAALPDDGRADGKANHLDRYIFQL
jgi:hypothetical protein